MRRMRLFSSLASVYQMEYNLHAVIFTSTEELIQCIHDKTITVVRNYPVNKFHLPIVRCMFQYVSERFDSFYYGYLNSDILLPANVFDVIAFMKQMKELSPMHEIAGRVYFTPYELLPDHFETIDDVKNTFAHLVFNKMRIRSIYSAVL
jgi:hypothetical protein